MPCESCHVQFTVFRRKRSCADCKRFYCTSCLSTKRRSNNVHFAAAVLLCKRCLIFAKRPLLRSDLLELKPKDLIFYLQSKHISTTGCVEKDELVGLVLAHVQQPDDTASASSSSRPHADGNTNSFDNLKQTCQNIFTSITENISDSFTSFDTKTSPKGDTQCHQNVHGYADNEARHIFDQPRVSTREIPTYASYLNSHQDSSTRLSPTFGHVTPVPASSAPRVTNDLHEPSSLPVITKSSGTVISPATSLSSSEASDPDALVLGPEQMHASTSNQCKPLNEYMEKGEMHSDCECSDEEVIATFSERAMMQKNVINVPNKEQLRSPAVELDELIGSKSRASTDINGCEISSQSSFEELGAIGGISDESKATTDTNSSNMDQWQILDGILVQAECSTNDVMLAVVDMINDVAQPVTKINGHDESEQENLEVAELNCSQREIEVTTQPIAPQRVKKVTRRRSDSYLNKQRQRPASEDDSPTGECNEFQTLHEQELENMTDTTDDPHCIQQQNRRYSCLRCGKHKASLRRQVEKMRRHLEGRHMSEVEIKQELQDFLVFLEQRSKSIECSDAETAVSSASGQNCGQASVPVTPIRNYHHLHQQLQYQQETQPWEYELDDNDGIHVYAATSSDANYSGAARFINLEDFHRIEDLEGLSVKKLKEILMLHRVDYKGCCEKKELLDRVQRLWKNLKSAPAVEKLQTDELCKICMDAPIECVILECGHMATCTNCGKVLSECPICRQYIVRVVRFFRA